MSFLYFLIGVFTFGIIAIIYCSFTLEDYKKLIRIIKYVLKNKGK